MTTTQSLTTLRGCLSRAIRLLDGFPGPPPSAETVFVSIGEVLRLYDTTLGEVVTLIRNGRLRTVVRITRHGAAAYRVALLDADRCLVRRRA